MYSELEGTSEKRFDVLDYAPVGMCVIKKDYTVLFWNTCLEDWTEIKKSEIVGNDLRIYYPHFKDIKYHSRIEGIFRGGPPVIFSSQLHKHLFPSGLPNGERRIQHTTVTTLPSQDGTEFYALFACEDVTELTHRINEQRKTEKELRESEEKYRTILENIEEGYYEVDLSGKFTFFNDSLCRILGYQKDDLMGMDNRKYMDNEQAKRVYQIFNEVYRTKESTRVLDWEIIRKDGAKRYIEASVSPIHNSSGEPIGFKGIAHDITERKLAEEDRKRLAEEISEKNKELEQVIYVTSHDLRSPLVNVQGFSKELDYTMKDLESILQSVEIPLDSKKKLDLIFEEDIPETITFIDSSIKKMDSLLTGLLRLSRLGRAALSFEDLDMNLMLSAIKNIFEFRIKEEGVNVEIGELPSCVGDAVQINQVFSNLIDNAIKYRDPKRDCVIKIRGEQKGEKVIYCVEDNGIGISKEHQKDIFVIFRRLDPKGTSGEGLGLTLVSKILSRNNGKIWLESESGFGSKFFVSLPKVDEKDERGENYE